MSSVSGLIIWMSICITLIRSIFFCYSSHLSLNHSRFRRGLKVTLCACFNGLLSRFFFRPRGSQSIFCRIKAVYNPTPHIGVSGTILNANSRWALMMCAVGASSSPSAQIGRYFYLGVGIIPLLSPTTLDSPSFLC